MTRNDSDKELDQTQVHLTAMKNVVCSYVRKNTIQAKDLPKLILDVADAFAETGLKNKSKLNNVNGQQKPAISKRRSLSDTELICLECGKSFKSLKRHLMAAHRLTPHEYRAKWELPSDYPMVAPAYSSVRSMLAIENKLGNS